MYLLYFMRLLLRDCATGAQRKRVLAQGYASDLGNGGCTSSF